MTKALHLFNTQSDKFGHMCVLQSHHRSQSDRPNPSPPDVSLYPVFCFVVRTINMRSTLLTTFPNAKQFVSCKHYPALAHCLS